ncbi:MAG: tetratricopeptide repeat protein [Nitrospinae bacterium]|nr:tetratricopeptide repeat protein [Nitrospinota bacterium]
MNYQDLKKNIRDAARGVKKGMEDVKVMIVEHEDVSSNMLFNALKNIGFVKIEKCRRTAHALDLMERADFDLYFINYRLRGEDMGINLIDHLYAYGYQEKALAFLLLRDKEKIPADFPPEYNSDGILQKPFKTAKICSLVSDACSKKIVRMETVQLIGQNKHREAIILNLQSSGQDKNKIWGTLFAGDVYERLNKFQDAVTLYRAILKYFPNCAIAYDAIGLVLRKLGRNSEAEYNFITSADKNPYYLRAKHHLAELYYWNGNKEKAKEILKLALRINPLSVLINKDFARVSIDLGEYEAAKKALKLVLQNPREAENPDVLIDYGNALMMNKELEEALENFNRSIDKSRTQENVEEQCKILKKALTAKGACYLKYEDPEKKKLAEGCFNAAEKAMGKTAASQEDLDEFALSVGKSYFEHGMEEEGEKRLSRFIEKDPKNKGRQEKIKGVFQLFNKVKKAMELIEQAIQKAVDDIEERDKENRRLRKLGRFKEAVESYEELLGRYPSDDGLHFNCGRTCMEWSKSLDADPEAGREKQNKAYSHFLSALKLDPERIPPALRTLGVDENAMNEYSAALGGNQICNT